VHEPAPHGAGHLLFRASLGERACRGFQSSCGFALQVVRKFPKHALRHAQLGMPEQAAKLWMK
jgi:hypothetical protein